MAEPLTGISIVKVLSDDPHTKVTCLLARKNGTDAVLLLKRRHFDNDEVERIVEGGGELKELYVNDVYHQYLCKTPPTFSDSTVDLIFPATQKHVQKYMDQERVMVRESADMYTQIVAPFVKALPSARLEWIYNILEKKAETERLLFEDPDPSTGFVLLPDMKWDCINMELLYCVGLCIRRDLHTLRDLTADHLPLLLNMQDKGCEAIQDKYGVSAASLRMFVHYHPTYYHFHVHYAHVKLQGPATLAGKAFLLDDIIDNIQNIAGDYYQRRTLTYSLGMREELAPLVLPPAVTQADSAIS